MTGDLLYHGTRAAFSGSGGLLLPATQHGGPTNHEATNIGDRSAWVYVTPDLDLAWGYAYVAKGKGRPRVLVVTPAGDLYDDDSTVGGAEQESYRCEAAHVTKVLVNETTSI